MSIGIMKEVWDSDIPDSRRKLILLSLADNAGDETRECWPSVNYVAKRCGCSVRTVHRHLIALESDGLIERKHRYTEKGSQRSNMYVITPLCQTDTPPYHARHTPPVMDDIPPPVTGVIQNHKIEPSLEHKRYCSFDVFWDVYPRKVGKKKAQQAFKKCVHPVDALIADVRNRLENDEQWQDPKYIPHPATYLNGEKWNDELTAKTVSDYDLIWQRNRDFCENENTVDGNGCDVRSTLVEILRPDGIGSVPVVATQLIAGND